MRARQKLFCEDIQFVSGDEMSVATVYTTTIEREKKKKKNLHGSKIRFSVCLLFDIIWMHGYLTCLQLQQKEKNYDDKQRRRKKYEVLRGHDGEIRKYTP